MEAPRNALQPVLAWSVRHWRWLAPIVATPVAGVLLGIGVAAAIDLPQVETVAELTPSQITRLLDRRNEVFRSYSVEKRIMLAEGEVPEIFERVLLTAEDRNFYSHGGFDIIGVARATVQNWRRGERFSGASTITMQVGSNALSRPRQGLEPEDPGDAVRRRARETPEQAADPDPLLQPDLLRPRQLRPRGRLPLLLRQTGGRAGPRAVRHPGGDPAGPERVDAVSAPRGRAQPPQRDPAGRGGARCDHEAAGQGGGDAAAQRRQAARDEAGGAVLRRTGSRRPLPHLRPKGPLRTGPAGQDDPRPPDAERRGAGAAPGSGSDRPAARLPWAGVTSRPGRS